MEAASHDGQVSGSELRPTLTALARPASTTNEAIGEPWHKSCKVQPEESACAVLNIHGKLLVAAEKQLTNILKEQEQEMKNQQIKRAF